MLVIGLISGTSVDGIDAALVEISGGESDLKIQLLAGETYSYPEMLRDEILAVIAGKALTMAEFAALDDAIAHAFAHAAEQIQQNQPKAELIGSHGQTVYHLPPSKISPNPLEKGALEQLPVAPLSERYLELPVPPSSREILELPVPPFSREVLELPVPPSSREVLELPVPPFSREVLELPVPPFSREVLELPVPPFSRGVRGVLLGYSLQLGRGALIADRTGITTINNFRAADIAAGGQGAPLVSKIDACLLADQEGDRAIQNIGGIGNLTYLPAKSNPHWLEKITGWDTGPGNALLDMAVYKFSQGQQTYDANGAWAATGTICQPLVQQWLAADFFQQPPPKSTGRELFSRDYLEQCLRDATVYQLSDADILASLTELTAVSIAHSYRQFLPQIPQQVLLCGGGSRNLYLRERLRVNLDQAEVLTTNEFGISTDFKEAIAFAVLAYWRQQQIPGNLPQVTGAQDHVLLGEIYNPNRGFQNRVET
jgi:anhydro-N-acetylmuramic acid kinase